MIQKFALVIFFPAISAASQSCPSFSENLHKCIWPGTHDRGDLIQVFSPRTGDNTYLVNPVDTSLPEYKISIDGPPLKIETAYIGRFDTLLENIVVQGSCDGGKFSYTESMDVYWMSQEGSKDEKIFQGTMNRRQTFKPETYGYSRHTSGTNVYANGQTENIDFVSNCIPWELQ